MNFKIRHIFRRKERVDESFTCKNFEKTNKQTTGERENKIFGDSFSTNAPKYTHVYMYTNLQRFWNETFP